MAHTPGKWTMQDGEGSIEINSDRKDWSVIGTVSANHLGSREVSREEAIDNARLIIAAPELLEVCEQLQKDIGDRLTGKTTLMLRAALAKAKGQTP